MPYKSLKKFKLEQGQSQMSSFVKCFKALKNFLSQETSLHLDCCSWSEKNQFVLVLVNNAQWMESICWPG